MANTTNTIATKTTTTTAVNKPGPKQGTASPAAKTPAQIPSIKISTNPTPKPAPTKTLEKPAKTAASNAKAAKPAAKNDPATMPKKDAPADKTVKMEHPENKSKTAHQICDAYNAALNAKGKPRSDDWFKKQHKDFKARINSENKARCNAKCASLLALIKRDAKGPNTADMYIKLMNEPDYETLKIDFDRDLNEYSVGIATKQVDLFILEDYFLANTIDPKASITRDVNWRGLLGGLIVNLGLYHQHRLTSKKAPVQKLGVYKTVEGKEIDFAKGSTMAMTIQLNALVQAILPAGMVEKMDHNDMYALRMSAITAQDGIFTLKNEKQMIRAIFTCIMHNYNAMPYELRSKASVHKAPKLKVSKGEKPSEGKKAKTTAA